MYNINEKWVRSLNGWWDLNIGQYRARIREDTFTKKWTLYISFVPRIRTSFYEYDVQIEWDSTLTPTQELVFAKADEILKQEWPNVLEEVDKHIITFGY
jgi:hypothetical protein